MVENEQKYLSLLERAWAAAIVKPRTMSTRRSGGGGGTKRGKKRWTEAPRVGFLSLLYDGVSGSASFHRGLGRLTVWRGRRGGNIFEAYICI